MCLCRGVNSKSLIYESFNLDKELSKIDPVEVLTSGKITKDDIGRTVYLSNSKVFCQEWEIADVNHDGTSGTVDLISKYSINTDSTYTVTYDSIINVINPMLNGFGKNIYNSLVPLYGNKCYKIPHPTEIGFTSDAPVTLYADGYTGEIYNDNDNGNPYPLFGTPVKSTENPNARRRCYNGNAILNYGDYTYYWTRARAGQTKTYIGNLGSDNHIYIFNYENGKMAPGSRTMYAYVFVFIRFGKQ